MDIKKIVKENFKGLDELIKDEDLLLFYKDLIETCLKECYEEAISESKPLYIAASQVLHLHLCEQEGIGSGQPTLKQWLDAADKLSKALHP